MSPEAVALPLLFSGFRSSHIAMIAGLGAEVLGISRLSQPELSFPKPIHPFGLITHSEYSSSKNGKLNPMLTGAGARSFVGICSLVPIPSISIQLKPSTGSASDVDQKYSPPSGPPKGL